MEYFAQSPTCTVPVANMKEPHISLSIPESSGSPSDDRGLQNVQDSEDDSDTQDSGPLATAQSEDDDDNNDTPTSNASETDEDEDIEDSSGDEDSEDEDIEDSSGDEDNEDDIGSPGPTMDRRKKVGTGLSLISYFDPMKPIAKGSAAAAAIQLKCTKTISYPVPINFRSKRVEWTLYPHELDATKDYELVIGISTKNLQTVNIEEVVFTVNGVEERVEQESLKDEVLDETEVLRWKLATPKKVHNDNRMEMQVGLALKLKPMAAPLEIESFNLYYMELHVVGTMDSSTDPSLRVYQPLYDWILDIRGNGADDTIPFAISESGNYLATYRAAIEFWDLTNSNLSTPPNSSASTDPFSISAANLKHLSLSISWDGSQITASGKNSPFKLYERNRSKSILEKSTKAGTADLARFEGRGSFHKGAGSQRQSQEDEIFVAINQNTISIYRIYGAWEFLRTIHHTSPITSELIWDGWSTSRGIDDKIQGRHLICGNVDPNDSTAFMTGFMTESDFIWNLDSSRLVRTIKKASLRGMECLSSDASLLVVELDEVISSFCSHTGVHLATADYKLSCAVPVRGGNGLFHTSDGLIRSGVDFAPIYPSCKLPESARVLSISKEGESFKAFVKDRYSIYQQTWKSSPCNENCLAKLSAARKNVWSFIDFESHLEFSVKDKKKIASCSLHLVITDLTQQDAIRVVILDTLQRCNSTTEVTFSPKDRSLIVQNDRWICVYEMPRRFRDDVSLVSIQDPTDQHLTCVHERSYFGSSPEYSPLLQLKVSQLAVVSPALVRDDWWRLFPKERHLPRYINRHVNQPNGCDVEDTTQGAKMSMMERLCLKWFIDDDEIPLLEQVLGLSECQWVPQSGMGLNPVEYFFNEAKTEPQAKRMFHLLSDYCYRRAKFDQNLLFLSPIAACLPILLPHSKTAILALQKMAFFPVPLRSVIIERHAVIHPPEFRLKFWSPNPRPLSECSEPILQLESSGASAIEIDPTKDAFREEIFAATFNMIWTDSSKPDALKDTSYPAGVSPSMFYWIKMAPFVIHYKFNPWLEKSVTCHKFPLDALDNPALSALILFKWSTLGFYIWLTRFAFQCLFYALVIVTVFLQVYAPTHGSVTVLSGIIGVMSSTFLLLELSQSLRDRIRYLESFIYNLVDIAVFALPLGGCINQLNLRSTANEDNTLNPRGPNSWLFSFSILLIALHLLFELRVNKTVCRFVTAIVRIFSKIRIFFIIFLVGQLAFTTALLHLLRGCVQEPCAELTTSFPGNYYLAFSATFFFMGGKYDPISDVFTQANWAFHTMMIIYLFFTVILMLNVLIALINSGYDESDTTWELVWLQNRLLYIENAENLSHSIPGLREKYDIFPQVIYYCLPETKIQEYKTRWSKNDGLWTKNDDLWSVEETKTDILKREAGSKQKKLNTEDLMLLLLMKGGRMDNLEQQLKRIERMLRDQKVKTKSETSEFTTDDSESSNE
ncbi:hypothetical protein BGZ49_008017 [Haplosporangium sp. Z 27]|nr:hypothetical protein BGZ49_008017 [Haplosporangium sp. Z 27]